MNIPVLETERLIMRAPEERDLDGVFEFHNDSLSVSVYHETPSRMEIWKRIAARLGHWHMRGYGPWSLEEKATGAYVGGCSLYKPEGWADVEIGYGIHPKFRGRGFAVEAAKRARLHGYQTLGLERLVSYVNPVNANSNRVAQKLGAVPESDTFEISGIAHIIYLHTKH